LASNFYSRYLSLSFAQKLLSPVEGLFTFVSDEETEATYAFMVTKDDARAYKVDLSEEQIAEIVRTLRAGIDLSNSFGIGDLPNFDMNLSYDLYSSLFGPAEDMLDGVEHLLVVPTGPLESLPLNLLVTEEPEIDPAASVFDNYQAAAWLPKSYSLTRLPSVSSLRALRVFAAAGEAKEPFIGFGDPILNGDAGDLRGLELASVYRGTTADIDQVRNLPELPDTADELKRIAQYLRASDDKIYLRERATETVLKNTDLTNSRVVAFATHGLVGGEISGLAEPALVLSPPDEATEEDDGLLKASEVAQLKMNADIIMLSACNTASGDELGAEGLSGLARAFIYAGARSLLVSHWSVESTSAAELTTGMFDAMSADKSIGRSEALQMSMVDLMTDKERSYYSHPAFWAPFSLVGDGATLN
jgi:CHAT domain-containing protein